MPTGGVISKLLPSLIITHSLGSITELSWSKILNWSLSNRLISEIASCSLKNLILPAQGESSNVFPISQPPVAQNKNCSAA